MQNPNDIQIGGNHYKGLPVQHWDLMYWLQADYHTGCASKYLIRFDAKNGIEDLKKAMHFISKLGYLGELSVWRRWYRAFQLWRYRFELQEFLDATARLSLLPQSLEHHRRQAVLALLHGDLVNALELTQSLICRYEEHTTHDTGIPGPRYANQG
jgi:hypothetical protein